MEEDFVLNEMFDTSPSGIMVISAGMMFNNEVTLHVLKSSRIGNDRLLSNDRRNVEEEQHFDISGFRLWRFRL